MQGRPSSQRPHTGARRRTFMLGIKKPCWRALRRIWLNTLMDWPLRDKPEGDERGVAWCLEVCRLLPGAGAACTWPGWTPHWA